MHCAKTVLYILAVPAALYLALGILLYLLQSKMVYHPWQAVTARPGRVGLRYQDVTFRTADGLELTGWFVPADSSRGLVLICHGNAGNISHRLETLRIFHEIGYASFIFDYRGYGASQGTPSEKGTYRDAEAAWEHVIEAGLAKPDEIILFGRSLGGAVASWLAVRHRPRALVLESTFTSAPDLGKGMFPYLPVRLLSRFGYRTVDWVQQITCPVLVVHSKDDDLVPYAHGRKLYDAAREPKGFLDIVGSHNDGFMISGMIYREGLEAFFSAIPGREGDQRARR